MFILPVQRSAYRRNTRTRLYIDAPETFTRNSHYLYTGSYTNRTEVTCRLSENIKTPPPLKNTGCAPFETDYSFHLTLHKWLPFDKKIIRYLVKSATSKKDQMSTKSLFFESVKILIFDKLWYLKRAMKHKTREIEVFCI